MDAKRIKALRGGLCGTYAELTECLDEIERLKAWLREQMEALSFITDAIDPDQSDETSDWTLLDSRWRRRVDDMHKQIKRLQDIIQFALDKCACRSAGNTVNPFAYLWKPDWDEFERRALEVLGGADETH